MNLYLEGRYCQRVGKPNSICSCSAGWIVIRCNRPSGLPKHPQSKGVPDLRISSDSQAHEAQYRSPRDTMEIARFYREVFRNDFLFITRGSP